MHIIERFYLSVPVSFCVKNKIFISKGISQNYFAHTLGYTYRYLCLVFLLFYLFHNVIVIYRRFKVIDFQYSWVKFNSASDNASQTYGLAKK